MPRQVGIGGRLDFAALADSTITVADPSGRVVGATLDQSRVFHPDLIGEWLFEIRDGTGVAALFPVYAGMVPPEITVLEVHPPPVDAEAAAKGFRTAFDGARDAYGMTPLGDDTLLASAARAMVRQRTSAPDLAAQLGYDVDKIWRIECIARTIEGCVDQVLWNPRARPALLATTADVGVAAELVSQGIHVVAIIGTR